MPLNKFKGLKIFIDETNNGKYNDDEPIYDDAYDNAAHAPVLPKMTNKKILF